MRAVIFDIDGTLLDSFEDDAALYGEAVKQVMGEIRLREQWGQYPHVSDTGILAEICRDNGCVYEESLSDAIRDVFIGKVQARMATHGPYRQIPGALDFVTRLRQQPDVQIGYATGGWRASAELKLRSAGFPLEGVPLATANDHPERQHIMQHAVKQLRGPFRSITYFGDGVWDQKATAALGWEFVPVGPKLGGLSSFHHL